MIIFENPGSIDLDAALTMGASVKESTSPIGYFGTGLKFAIATILRNGGEIWITDGNGNRSTFLAAEETLRGERFHVVYRVQHEANAEKPRLPERLNFTTELGRDWEPWMAFRELATNAIDEGGRYARYGDDSDFAEIGKTFVHVKGIDHVWPDRHTIILEGEPIVSTEYVDIYQGTSIFAFYRGVRIFKSGAPFGFTYNIKREIDLTEDRTAKYPWQISYAIERAIGELEDQTLLRRILTLGDGYYEHDLDTPQYGAPGPAFKEAARKLANEGGGAKANPKAIAFARHSALDDMDEGGDMELSDLDRDMLDRAFRILSKVGVDRGKYPLQLCESLGPAIHGLARDGKLYLSRLAFEKGTRELAATIFEEWAHLESGHGDNTRGFQTWLIDRIMIAAERASSEPF